MALPLKGIWLWSHVRSRTVTDRCLSFQATSRKLYLSSSLGTRSELIVSFLPDWLLLQVRHGAGGVFPLLVQRNNPTGLDTGGSHLWRATLNPPPWPLSHPTAPCINYSRGFRDRTPGKSDGLFIQYETVKPLYLCFVWRHFYISLSFRPEICRSEIKWPGYWRIPRQSLTCPWNGVDLLWCQQPRSSVRFWRLIHVIKWTNFVRQGLGKGRCA